MSEADPTHPARGAGGRQPTQAGPPSLSSLEDNKFPSWGPISPPNPSLRPGRQRSPQQSRGSDLRSQFGSPAVLAHRWMETIPTCLLATAATSPRRRLSTWTGGSATEQWTF